MTCDDLQVSTTICEHLRLLGPITVILIAMTIFIPNVNILNWNTIDSTNTGSNTTAIVVTHVRPSINNDANSIHDSTTDANFNINSAEPTIHINLDDIDLQKAPWKPTLRL
ncbi:hypothetical protein BYT27DRAFT_7251498 [Phlegmacium glaucopus]|nr:hypothetical protein BYT27DRAFT_7251498 [Phlegmacium glaucopus]